MNKLDKTLGYDKEKIIKAIIDFRAEKELKVSKADKKRFDDTVQKKGLRTLAAYVLLQPGI